MTYMVSLVGYEVSIRDVEETPSVVDGSSRRIIAILQRDRSQRQAGTRVNIVEPSPPIRITDGTATIHSHFSAD